MLISLIVACDDSLGTDPDYKKTIFERDTIVRIDTIVTIDTVKSSDSTEYLFTIDSLIIIRDSLGFAIDSLKKEITKSRAIAPRFNPILDSVYTLVTYLTYDTLYDEQQQDFTIEKIVTAIHQPQQAKFNGFEFEMDTNLNRNWAWLDFTFDGKFDERDTTAQQHVFLADANVLIDSVLTFNSFSLTSRQRDDNFSYTSTILDIKGVNVTSNTNNDVIVSFGSYSFDNTGKINGLSVEVEFDILAFSIPYVNRFVNYNYLLVYRYE